MGQIEKKVAIIPARGGSKRIPRKNIKLFSGKPVIAHSILAAKNSELFDCVFVSTEDEEIAEVSKTFGAEIIQRPLELSDDYTETIPVIRHAIEWMSQREMKVDAVCCIYGCTPLVLPEDIIKGFNYLINGQWEFVCSATQFEYPIHRGFKINSDNSLTMLDEEKYHVRTQDLEQIFHDADKFYWGQTRTWMEKSMIFSKKSAAVKIPQFRVQVIDNQEDWIRAENIYMILKNGNDSKQEKLDGDLDKKNIDINLFLDIIDEIENVRTKNNVNWMDILRLAFIHAPKDASKLLKRINTMDNRVSELINKLSSDSNDRE